MTKLTNFTNEMASWPISTIIQDLEARVSSICSKNIILICFIYSKIIGDVTKFFTFSETSL